MEQGCQWPDGCNAGGFRIVAVPDVGERFLCLRHAGAVWNGRKAANRAAGRCACGAKPTRGYRTCARCRARNTADRRRARQVSRQARECGIVLPRENGRRRAFIAAYRTAARHVQRAAYREVRQALRRGRRWRGARIVSTSWEGQAVTVAAVLLDGRVEVGGIPPGALSAPS